MGSRNGRGYTARGVPPRRDGTSSGWWERRQSPRTVTPRAVSSSSYTATRTWLSWLPAIATTTAPSARRRRTVSVNRATADAGGIARS